MIFVERFIIFGTALEMITGSRIEELLTYSNGEFFWKTRAGSAGRRRSGKRAGYVSKYGYRIICLDYKDYFEHNLVWLAEHGKWPPEGYEIDHKDRCKTNNKPENLRLCDRPQNCANQKIRKDNKSGCRGVHWDAKRQKWNVQITIRGQTKSLGRYDNLAFATHLAEQYRRDAWGEFASTS